MARCARLDNTRRGCNYSSGMERDHYNICHPIFGVASLSVETRPNGVFVGRLPQFPNVFIREASLMTTVERASAVLIAVAEAECERQSC